ncbi:hypothetical protein ABIE69_002542 [Rhodobacteraceae bacterium MBR-64]
MSGFMLINRRSVLASALALPFVTALSQGAAAGGSAGGSAGVGVTIARMSTRDGMALGGYDPVAYFDQGRPMVGDVSHRLKWHGAIWQFASADHRQVFEMNPKAYAPEFGGYCAYTVAQGRPFRGEPELWTITDGRLYLNYDTRLQTLWRQDMMRLITEARRNWSNFNKV